MFRSALQMHDRLCWLALQPLHGIMITENFVAQKEKMHDIEAMCAGKIHASVCSLRCFQPHAINLICMRRDTTKFDVAPVQADSTPPAMSAGGMVYSSDKCLNHTAESTTHDTDSMW